MRKRKKDEGIVWYFRITDEIYVSESFQPRCHYPYIDKRGHFRIGSAFFIGFL